MGFVYFVGPVRVRGVVRSIVLYRLVMSALVTAQMVQFFVQQIVKAISKLLVLGFIGSVRDVFFVLRLIAEVLGCGYGR